VRRAGPASILLAVLGIGSAPMMASARDFGSFGPTWSIAEPDLLAVIKARLEAARQNGKLNAMNQRFVEAAQASVRRPHAVAGITPATSDRRWSFDPRVTLSQDIRDARGNLIAAQGQRFNPLTHLNLAHSFAFIDGDSAVEREWALRQGAPDKLWIVLVKGSPTDLMKATQRRFYFDQMGGLTGKFGIAHTPALLVQQGDHLDIREVALPVTGERAGERR
jgi:conjugal transfer pilus assembly protein TraW